jgi:hypothetical protein
MSGGAKEVQAAWQLTPTPCRRNANSGTDPVHRLQPADETYNAQSCTGRWLATLPPPKGGLRPKRNAGFHSAIGERRTLALCLLRPAEHSADGSAGACTSSESYFLVQSSSGGDLTLQQFHVGPGQWSRHASLTHGNFVILSIAVACVEAPEGAAGGHTMVCAGASDGSMYLWDVSGVLQKCCGDLQPVQPVLHMPRSHQTGVNALLLGQLGAKLWAVSGGDDQALHVTLLEHVVAAEQNGPTWRVVESVAVACAHASAVKGLCWRPAEAPCGRSVLQVCSIGWDEFLIVWQVEAAPCHGGTARGPDACARGPDACALGEHGSSRRVIHGNRIAIRELLKHAVDVCEPCCVGSCDMAGLAWNVVVGGRGTQLLSLHVPPI